VMTVHNLRLRCPNGLMYTEGAVCRRCQRGNYAHATLHECFSSRKQGLAYASSLWLHRFVLRLESKVTQFIAPSEFMRQRLVDWGIASDRVSLVRCVTPIPPEVPDLGAHGIFVGRVSAEKGLDILLQGLAGAGDPPFRIVGDGPEFGDVARLAQRLGLKRTEFVGKVDKYQVSELMRDSRFVVIPSRWEENAPLVAAEAMALGRPLIVSRIGGLPEFVAGGAGISFPVDDVSELAEAIRRLTDDAESCRDMGNHAREFALREFSGDRHVVRLQELYDAVSR
ncbi:MAG: glycosyltransferase family 4 protein, partial [Acidimicrobiia bacterium]